MDYGKCGRIECKKIFVVSENKSKFVLENKDRVDVRQSKVDGCLVDDHRERCDYMFESLCSDSGAIKKAIYVELKGKNIEKAVSQLKSTVSIFHKEHSNSERFAFAVLSRHPKMSTKQQRYIVEMKKQGVNFKSCNLKETHSI